MDTIFMNSINSKTSGSHRLLLNLSDKTNLKRNRKCTTHGKVSTSHVKTTNLTY